MELDISHSIGQGVIVHKRTKDTKNFFKYKAPYLCINLHQSKKIHPFISFNRFNIFSIFFKQHGYRDKKKNLVTFEKIEPKQWKTKDEMLISYNRWLEKWK